jgi:hypothetical protein
MVLKYVRRGCGPGTERISYQQQVFFAQDVIELPYTNYLALRVSPDLLKNHRCHSTGDTLPKLSPSQSCLSPLPPSVILSWSSVSAQQVIDFTSRPSTIVFASRPVSIVLTSWPATVFSTNSSITLVFPGGPATVVITSNNIFIASNSTGTFPTSCGCVV